MIGRKGYIKLMFNERVALAVKILCRQINILIQIPFHGNTVLSELTLAYLQIFIFSSHFRIQLASHQNIFLEISLKRVLVNIDRKQSFNRYRIFGEQSHIQVLTSKKYRDTCDSFKTRMIHLSHA